MSTDQPEFDFDAKPKSEASAAIIDRIKKLLRLGADQRGNSHEAERATQLAFELAEKYRVDMAGLDLDEESARLVSDHFEVGMRFDQLRRGVFGILTEYFHVTMCLCSPRLLVVGKPHDVVIAHYIHDFLLRAGRNCLRAYESSEKQNRRRMSTTKRRGYLAGFIYGLHNKLGQARQAVPLTDAIAALVVSEEADRQRKIEELVPNTRTLPALKGRVNRTAAEIGYRDGNRTNIHQPIGTSAGSSILLLS